MQQAAEKINAAFAELDSNETFEQIGSNDSMSSIAGKVKRNFAKITDSAEIQEIEQSDSMSEIANKLDANFAIAEQAEPQSEKFSFYHTSDPHGKREGVRLMKNRLKSSNDDCAFGIITGDLKYGSSGIYYELEDLIEEIPNGKLLLTNGNHDTYDKWASDSKYCDTMEMTDYMYQRLCSNNDIGWGEIDQVQNKPIMSSYYYVDYDAVGNLKVRVIVIDQYEINAAVRAAGNLSYEGSSSQGGSYNKIYTTTQMEWLENVLKNTPSNYHIVMAMHTCPYTSAYPFTVPSQEPYLPEQLFISESLSAGWFGTDGNNIICNIVKAYLAKSTYSATFNNGSLGGSLPSTGSFTVDVDFTSVEEPAKFWCYLFGHLHCDVCFFAPSETFPNQLLLGMNCSDYNVSNQGGDDLYHAWNSSLDSDGYKEVAGNSAQQGRVNKVTLDFTNNTVLIERIGQQKTIGGRIRDKIMFNLETGAVSHPE